MNKLKRRRQEKGMSQSELAEKADVSLRNLQYYEQGSRDINKASVLTVYKLAEALDCKIVDLIELDEYNALKDINADEILKKIIGVQKAVTDYEEWIKRQHSAAVMFDLEDLSVWCDKSSGRKDLKEYHYNITKILISNSYDVTVKNVYRAIKTIIKKKAG